MNKTSLRIAQALLAMASLGTAGADVIVFQEDFESGTAPSQITGGAVQTTGGIHASVGSRQYRNGATLSLTGLPAHQQIRISFTFLAWDSWDGTGSGDGPDYFNVKLDGTSLFAEAFANASGSTTFVTSGGAGYTGSQLVSPFVGDFAFLAWNDAAYTIDIQFVNHTSSTATFSFFRSFAGEAPNTSGPDETIGLDNIVVAVNDVPEPASIGLAGLGGLAMALLRRR
ncbi:MAG: PEP-CTERM sorting domain-containing protein [Bryobacterales bacterium]|nr:PEP-CTERM sorting domain-containing protein [Bryobacterales bacterium]